MKCSERTSFSDVCLPLKDKRSICKDCIVKKHKIGSNFHVNKFIDELVHQAKTESGNSFYWNDLCYNELNQCLLIKPPLNNERIVRQNGLFIMAGFNPDDIYEPPKDFKNFFICNKKRTYYYFEFNQVNDIKADLAKLGIDTYFIYPELESDIKVRKKLFKEEN